MKLLRSGCALILSLMSAAAFAQGAGRSFVSAGSGSDSNGCTRQAPCRSFGAALATTVAGGEVIALDSGGYGPVSVNKSISITSPAGVYAGITGSVALIPAVAVNAGASGSVVLDGLTLNSTGSNDGIDVIAAKTVVVKNLRITGFPDEGIFLTAPADLIVSDTVFRVNGDGIDAKCATRATLSIEHSSFEDNDLTGILIDDNIDASIRNSVIHGTNGVGLKVAPTTGGATSQADVEACIFTHNFSAIRSGGNGGTAAVRVSNSTITMNTFGLNTNPGSTLTTRTNNTLEANDSDGSFTGSFTAK